jgi:hypothetical protein
MIALGKKFVEIPPPPPPADNKIERSRQSNWIIRVQLTHPQMAGRIPEIQFLMRRKRARVDRGGKEFASAEEESPPLLAGSHWQNVILEK